MHSIIEEVHCVGRGILAANLEAWATLADTFGSAMHRVANSEEVTTAQSWGQGARSSVRPWMAASEEVVRGIGQVPRNFLRAYDRAYVSPARTTCDRTGTDTCGTESKSTSNLEDAIYVRAQREIRENGGKGALLNDFVHDLAREFEVSEEKVRNLVARHFVVRGEIIREKHEANEPTRAIARERLTNLGYTDIREDVPLQLINEHADLIAFEGTKPKILCYCNASSPDDLNSRKYARLQANSYSEGGPIPYIWVTDGRTDYFADLSKDSAISALPRASAAKSSAS